MFIACVESFKIDDEIASGQIHQILRLQAAEGGQKFMNCCGKCLFTQHQIQAKFHFVPKVSSRPELY